MNANRSFELNSFINNVCSHIYVIISGEVMNIK